MKTETIRCRDLMVGDWCCDHHGFPMQITNVGDDYAYATFEGNEGDPWEFNDKDDQPCAIEITDDILKQNKWEVQGYALLPSEHYFVKDDGGNHLLWSHGTLSIWLACGEDNDGVFSDVVLPCKYVHQLQHALRLCGLDELADKFKV